MTRLRALYTSRTFALFLVLLGAFLRLRQYVHNRSLWQDEASLALNLMDKSFAELLGPLSLNQGAPPGFLFLSKAAITVFGTSEYALRLTPLLSGLIALLLFYRVADRLLAKEVLPVALCLFAVSRYPIYYASELKQYSGDVAVALLLYWLLFASDESPLTAKRTALLAVAGALAPWLSHASVFVLAAVAAGLALGVAKRKERRELRPLLVIGLSWGASFALLYLLNLRNLLGNRMLSRYWASGFMPFPPTSFADLYWPVTAFARMLEHPLDMPMPALAASATA